MISGLQRSPLIRASVPQLTKFWNSGFTATRAVMTCVVEQGMSSEDFLAVAKAQAPLYALINAEVDLFSRAGWGAVPGADHEKPIAASDQFQLSLFRHDVVSKEGFFPSVVELAERSDDRLSSWYGHAQFLYRKRLAVEQLLKGICYIFFAEASEKRISLASRVSMERCFSEACFDPAKAAFKNLVSNAIKHGKDDGSLEIWNEGLQLFFKDDGIGMHPNFAARLGRGEQLREGRADVDGEGLGWVSIGETARALGWKWEITANTHAGTTVSITLNDSNFAPPTSTWEDLLAERSHPDPVTAQEIIEGSRVFVGAEPFQGYALNNNGRINITESPIFKATVQACQLVSRL